MQGLHRLIVAMADGGGREARVRNAVAFLQHPKVRAEGARG